MTKSTSEYIYSPDKSWQIFDRISSKYDFLNHLLSLGLDTNWRRELKFFLPERSDQSLLDLATGTGDVLLVLSKDPRIGSAYGLDRSKSMLDLAQKKIAAAGLKSSIKLMEGNAAQIPFESETFDVVTMAFGIRNTESPPAVLQEMVRVLKRGGRALILEFSLPENVLLRWVSLFYLRRIVPFVGGLISGDRPAYRYLNKTIESFPYGDDFCDLMNNACFSVVRYQPLTFGIATIYQGTK